MRRLLLLAIGFVLLPQCWCGAAGPPKPPKPSQEAPHHDSSAAKH